jgi:hypothetical protein
MKRFAFLSLLLLFAYASLVASDDHDNDNNGCLSHDEAHSLLAYYVKFFENMTDPTTLTFAQAHIADDFQLFSDSTNGFLGNAVSSSLFLKLPMASLLSSQNSRL